MVDESTFKSFYERTKQSLWLYIAKMMKDETLANDIFQDAYIKFLQSSVEHTDESRMKSYLYRIATNLMNDHWRKMKRERNWLEADTAIEPTINKEGTVDLRHDIGKAFHQLSHQQRSLLWLAYAEEYEHKEIAGILRLRVKSVKVLLFRAKQKLIEVCHRMGITSEGIV